MSAILTFDAHKSWKLRLLEARTSARLQQRAELARQVAARPTCKAIISLVAEYYGLRMDEMTGLNRFVYLIEARRMACVVCQRLLGAKTTHIGRALNRDHSTVCHHLARSKEAGFNWADCTSIEELINSVRNSHPVDNAHKVETTHLPPEISGNTIVDEHPGS